MMLAILNLEKLEYMETSLNAFSVIETLISFSTDLIMRVSSPLHLDVN